MTRQDPMAVLWARLQAAEPTDVARRAAIRFHPDPLAYCVPLLDSELRIFPTDRRVGVAPGGPCPCAAPGGRLPVGPDGAAGFEPTLVCVQYLLTARDEPLAGERISPRSLPYGDFFFRGLHEVPTARLEQAFGERTDAFHQAAQAVGGRPAEGGDAAYEFRALPRVPVTVVLWAADDEFPARAQFLLDRFADHQLPIDALWVLCKVLAKRLIAAADPPASG